MALISLLSPMQKIIYVIKVIVSLYLGFPTHEKLALLHPCRQIGKVTAPRRQDLEVRILPGVPSWYIVAI